jgi:hypothetical protein
MGMLDMWRQARGTVLRKEYEDTIARMQDSNAPAKSAFLFQVHQTIDAVVEAYSSASTSDRKTLLAEMSKNCLEMWKSGDWPSSLGLAISCLNAESRFVPGDDALYVRTETDRIVKEAAG